MELQQEGKITDELRKSLVNIAREAASKAYAPDSDCQVGAALLTQSGEIFTGCNVENAAYGGSICAERTAFVKAISQGHRKFSAIGVVCAKLPGGMPCGNCPQFICEFGADIEIIVEAPNGGIKTMTLSDILPDFFGPAALG